MAKNDLNDAQERVNWHWRNTMRPVRFFGLDARAAIPYIFLIPYFRWSTVILATIVTFIFWAMERRGLTFPAAMRSLRTWILGAKRPALISLKRRSFRDYG